MNLIQELKDFARAVYNRIIWLDNKIRNKLDKNVGASESGKILVVDPIGDITFEEDNFVRKADIDGKSYIFKDGQWVEFIKGDVTWTSILDKPLEFPPESHNHNDIYYSKDEINNLINSLGGSTSVVDLSLYYTKTEVDNLVQSKKDEFVENSAFNKNFGIVQGTVAEGDHTHNDVYFTKQEVRDLISNISLSHNHDDNYYLKEEVDSMLNNITSYIDSELSKFYNKKEVDNFLNSKSDVGHNHNDLYYIKDEIDALINNSSSNNSVNDFLEINFESPELKVSNPGIAGMYVNQVRDLDITVDFIKNDGGDPELITIKDLLTGITLYSSNSVFTSTIITLSSINIRKKVDLEISVKYKRGTNVKTASSGVDYYSTIESGTVVKKLGLIFPNLIKYAVSSTEVTDLNLYTQKEVYEDLEVIFTKDNNYLYLDTLVITSIKSVRDSITGIDILPNMKVVESPSSKNYMYYTPVNYLQDREFIISF